jgi:hypothetical protein
MSVKGTFVYGDSRGLPVTLDTYERQAARLFDAVRGACDPQVGFVARMEAGLGAALELFASEPKLARDLLLPPYDGAVEERSRGRQRWCERFGGLLRSAADTDSIRSRELDFLEPVLIGGIVSLVSREILTGDPERLPQLLPGLLEFLLIFYVAPPATAGSELP